MEKKPVYCLSFFLFFFLKLSPFFLSFFPRAVLPSFPPVAFPVSVRFPPSFWIFRPFLRAHEYYKVCPFAPFPSPVEKYVLQHNCKSVYYKQVSKKFTKKMMICLAFKLKAATFASAIERDAVPTQKWLAVNNVGNGPGECICTKYLTLTGIKGARTDKTSAAPVWTSWKNILEKTSENIWWFETNSLPLHPLSETMANKKKSSLKDL